MTELTKDTLEVLSCDIELRPLGAPGPGELASAIVDVERSGGVLVVSFRADALDTVERFVAAERQCCASIRWDVEVAPESVQLRVGAEPEQLDVLERMFRQARV